MTARRPADQRARRLPGEPDLLVEVQRSAGRRNVPSNSSLRMWLRAALAAAQARRPLPRGSTAERFQVTLRVVGAPEMQTLNARFRGRDYATNVLSFGSEALAGVPQRRVALGDLVLCTDVLLREAAEQGKALPAHWAHLCIHGLLHLLGYTHEARGARVRMEKVEREVLRMFGIADPYA